MKILIIGIVASGKTTLAKRLSNTLDSPFYELDTIVWVNKDGARIKMSLEAQLERIAEIDAMGSWIIEGTYRPCCDSLFTHAEQIIFLDPPLHIRKIRILTRFMRQKLGIEKCHYKPTFAMLRAMYKWTRDFEMQREAFEAKLQAHLDKVVHVKRGDDLVEFWAEKKPTCVG